MSNEDLKRYYEKSKDRKTNKEFCFENAHKSKKIVYSNSSELLLGGVHSLAVTSDNKFLISGSQDMSIKIFDLQTKELVHHFENAHKGKEIALYRI